VGNNLRAVYGFYGLCIRDSNLPSPAMANLTQTLNNKTPDDAHFFLVAGDDALDPALSAIEQQLDAALAMGSIPILIGHGAGAEIVVNECNRLAAKLPPLAVPIAGVIDPSNRAGNTIGDKQTVPGIWAIKANVGLAINPYTAAYPGGGHAVPMPGNSTTLFRPLDLPQYPHSATAGYDIVSCPETQDALITAVVRYVTTGKF
jgi:hypothetical protein